MTRPIDPRQLRQSVDEDVAFLRLSLPELKRRTKIAFSGSSDGLGDLDAAVMRLRSGDYAALIRHRTSPVAGVKLLMSDASYGAVAEVVAFLRLRRSDVSWISPAHAKTFDRVLRFRRISAAPRRPRLAPAIHKVVKKSFIGGLRAAA